MVWLIVLFGSKGFAMPNIILGAFIYLRPQFSKTFTNENHFVYCMCNLKTDGTNSL